MTHSDPMHGAADPAHDGAVERLLKLALEEDLGTGDVTSSTVVPADARACAIVHAKQSGVVAGLAVAERVLELAGVSFTVDERSVDGAAVKGGSVLLRLHGPARGLLSCERIMLNLLQRMSGIATATRRHVDAIAGFDCVVLETRKTVPGWRTLDKYAVRCGGGVNHRIGLFDQILVKENHFAMAREPGSLPDFGAALADLMRRRPPGIVVEVEVESLDEFRLALLSGVDIIMLDDMSLEDMRAAVEARDRHEREQGRPAALIEASGGITLARIRDVAATGVERISIGALTHSVVAMDIAMQLERA